MGKIILSKSAGFCFGVSRAIKMLYNIIDSSDNEIYTLGPIIHNPQIISELEQKGVKITDRIDDIPINNSLLVVRTHGISENEMNKIKSNGIKYTDMTCPFVSKIQKIVKEESDNGKTVLIAGDPEHPEIIGIKSYCNDNNGYVIKNLDELISIEEKGLLDKRELIIVAQTTYNTSEWKKICEYLRKKYYTKLSIFDTICNATEERQKEAAELAATVDLMIVIGGKNSSNTTKLYDICRKSCIQTYHIETAAELPLNLVKKAKLIGVTAGASTPDSIIKEVIKTMEEINNNNASMDDDVDFAEALEQSLKTLHSGEIVKGVVVSVQPNEVQLDLGIKHTGIIPISEITEENQDLNELFKIGQVVEAQIIKMNDQEGTVTLSKKKIDFFKAWDEIVNANETKEILSGTVSQVVKGGIIVLYKGIRVFIPASQASLRKDENLNEYLNTPVKFTLLEVENGRRKKVIGSMRSVLKEEKKEAEESLLNSIEIGKEYKGTVKSLTTYGAFVDLGGLDGMVHITELSWARIKHPSEVVKVGDVISVYVKDFDKEGKRISLGYKKSEDNPWELFSAKYKVDDIVDVKIVKLMPYGAFAEILPGIDGLIHISEISDKRINKPSDVLKVGDTVKAKITEIDDKKHISLSLKALIEADISDENTEVTQE